MAQCWLWTSSLWQCDEAGDIIIIVIIIITISVTMLKAGDWDGMVAELVNKKADIALGSLRFDEEKENEEY